MSRMRSIGIDGKSPRSQRLHMQRPFSTPIRFAHAIIPCLRRANGGRIVILEVVVVVPAEIMVRMFMRVVPAVHILYFIVLRRFPRGRFERVEEVLIVEGGGRVV